MASDDKATEDVVELKLADTKEDSVDADEDSIDEPRSLHRWVRYALVLLTVPWILVFSVAIFLINPYNRDGEAERAGVHQQLGLPECNFKTLTGGIPCPSCGMTTSFTLLMRADVLNSMRANFAGTALATFGVLFIPWALASAFFGRFMFVRSIEMVIFRLAIAFLILLFGRWLVVLVWELLLKT
jgi:hypothetical protein